MKKSTDNRKTQKRPWSFPEAAENLRDAVHKELRDAGDGEKDTIIYILRQILAELGAPCAGSTFKIEPH